MSENINPENVNNVNVDEQSSEIKAYAIIPPDQESRCCICGEEANGAPACWGCWDDALYQNLL